MKLEGPPETAPHNRCDDCNHTSPGSQDDFEDGRELERNGNDPTSPGDDSDASDCSQQSLGTQIEKFLAKQRRFSDKLEAESPKSEASVEQVSLDPNNSLILKVELDSIVSDGREEAKEATEPTTKPEMKLKQEKITDFFRKAVSEDSRLGLAAALASGSADFVSSNGSLEPEKQT